MICAKQLKGIPLGPILISLFLVAVKLKNETTAILEAAKGYKYVKAICLYNKVGFKPDISLRDSNCYPYTNNIPMSIDLNSIDLCNLFDIIFNNKYFLMDDSFCKAKYFYKNELKEDILLFLGEIQNNIFNNVKIPKKYMLFYNTFISMNESAEKLQEYFQELFSTSKIEESLENLII